MASADKTKEKLAASLTAETVDLLPYLPYLLQDLWELGSSGRDMGALIERHLPVRAKILDLACGKGAVAVHIAGELGAIVHGWDIMPEFIDFARKKARDAGVDGLCSFSVGDVNEIVRGGGDYDCVIFGAAGNILGSPKETLRKLAKMVKPGGYILLDESYLPDGGLNNEIKYSNYEYLTRDEWLQLINDCGLVLVEELQSGEEHDFDADNAAITARAKELAAKHPEKRAIFEGYVQSQQNECDDLINSLVSATWLLRQNAPPISSL